MKASKRCSTDFRSLGALDVSKKSLLFCRLFVVVLIFSFLMDKMEQQMTNMRRVTSGQYENLGLMLRAFYRRNDPSKLENKEAMDLVIKWTFKHGMKALNDKFEKHYGKTLDQIEIDDKDEEAEEGDDYVPDW